MKRTHDSEISAGDPSQPRDFDPGALARALEATGRFKKDTRLGAILHRGAVSIREIAPTHSVHLAFRGNKVHAHIDRFSPLNCGSQRRRHYSLLAVAVHNVADVIVGAARWVTGRRRDHCEFTCERVWVDDAADGVVLEIDGHDCAAGEVASPAS